MGGDLAPEQMVKGSFEYLRETRDGDISVTLVGQRDLLESEVAKYPFDHSRLQIIHADEVVTMHDRPARIIKTKRNSSLVRAVELVQRGEADGVVSAGNTGAVLTASLFLLKPIPGVRRPAICPLIPTAQGGFLLCDAGANVDVRARHLLQFALMAKAYATVRLDNPRPRIGLLNIGTEPGKGNELSQRAYDLLQLHVDNFVGNVEARDIFAGVADVVVCDGFVGNIMLKAAEGMVVHAVKWARDRLKRHPIFQLALPLMRPALRDLGRELDYEEHGGSPLLGVNGVSIVCHGTSSARAIRNALKLTAQCVSENLVDTIREGIEAHMDIFEERHAVTTS